ncbi:unnamed protein product [Chrysoparadoxa australica]
MVMRQNPGISLPDAFQKLTALKQAIANGEQPEASPSEMVAPPAVSALDAPAPGAAANAAVPAAVPAQPTKAPGPEDDSPVLMITNLRTSLNADQLKELVGIFGPLKRFNLLRDSEGTSKGTAVFEFETTEATAVAASGLQGMDVAGSKLSVQRVPLGMAETLMRPTKVLIKPVLDTEGDEKTASADPTPVVRVSGMLTAEELSDAKEIGEIKQDVTDECGQFGAVKSVVIPLPENDDAGNPVRVAGLGKVFLQFSDPIGAQKAIDALQLRTFGGKPLKACFYPSDLFERGIYGIQQGSKAAKGSEAVEPGFVLLADSDEAAATKPPDEEDDMPGEMPDFSVHDFE